MCTVCGQGYPTNKLKVRPSMSPKNDRSIEATIAPKTFKANVALIICVVLNISVLEAILDRSNVAY